MYILSKHGHPCQISGHCKSLRPKDLQVFFNCEFSGVATGRPRKSFVGNDLRGYCRNSLFRNDLREYPCNVLIRKDLRGRPPPTR